MDSAALKNRISPPVAKTTADYSAANVGDPTKKAIDNGGKDKVAFRDVLLNSNEEVARKQAAQKNGDGLKAAKTDEEFYKALNDKLNKDNLRKPNNALDKDAFLKLFTTQLQHQDPLNPDTSSEMASQLAQFHGLEQMLNVNKNLEKMMTEQATDRSVSLIGFVGKDIKLDSGKVKLEGGKVAASTYNLETDVPEATLELRDASGAVVATRSLGLVGKGEHKIEWDGLDQNGKKVTDGVYTAAITAKDINGQDVPVRITSTVRVTGVDLKDAGGTFYTALGKVRVGEIASIGAAGFGDKKAGSAPAAAKPGDEGGAGNPGQVEGAAAGTAEEPQQPSNDAARKEREEAVKDTTAENRRAAQVMPDRQEPALPFELTNTYSGPRAPAALEVPVPGQAPGHTPPSSPMGMGPGSPSPAPAG